MAVHNAWQLHRIQGGKMVNSLLEYLLLEIFQNPTVEIVEGVI